MLESSLRGERFRFGTIGRIPPGWFRKSAQIIDDEWLTAALKLRVCKPFAMFGLQRPRFEIHLPS